MRNDKFQHLRDRTFKFALDIVRFCRTFARGWEARRIADQLFRCGTSVGANYRAADRRRSDADFIAKLGVVIEECDECGYWLELLEASGINTTAERSRLADEAEELLRIFVASIGTAKENAARRQRAQRS